MLSQGCGGEADPSGVFGGLSFCWGLQVSAPPGYSVVVDLTCNQSVLAHGGKLQQHLNRLAYVMGLSTRPPSNHQ